MMLLEKKNLQFFFAGIVIIFIHISFKLLMFGAPFGHSHFWVAPSPCITFVQLIGSQFNTHVMPDFPSMGRVCSLFTLNDSFSLACVLYPTYTWSEILPQLCLCILLLFCITHLTLCTLLQIVPDPKEKLNYFTKQKEEM